MTRTILISLAAVTLGAGALVASSTNPLASIQRQGPGGPPQGRGGGPPSLASVLDLNHDGTIDGDEIAAAATSLRRLDANRDGQLTTDELFAAFGRGGPGGRGREGGGFDGRGREGGASSTLSADELTETLMAFDKNGDGKLTRAEVPERFQGLFDRADTNKDASLTRDEIRTAAAAQASQQGPPEGGRVGGRGRGGPGGMDPIVAALDTNRDGVLSPDEIAAASQALTALDRNADGQLSADETRPAFGRGRGGDRGGFGRDRSARR